VNRPMPKAFHHLHHETRQDVADLVLDSRQMQVLSDNSIAGHLRWIRALMRIRAPSV
jgi:hypothetical protein